MNGEMCQVCYIYGLFDVRDPDSIRYVGKSVQPRIRMNHHLSDASRFRGCNHRVNWINSVINRGSSIGMICIKCVDEAESCRVECEIIAQYKAAGASLVNGTNGGDGCCGMVLSEESRNKIRLKSIGRKQSLETVAKRVAKIKGMKRTPEQCEAIRQRKLGVKIKLTPQGLAARQGQGKGRRKPVGFGDKVSEALKGVPKTAKHIGNSVLSRLGKRRYLDADMKKYFLRPDDELVLSLGLTRAPGIKDMVSCINLSTGETGQYKTGEVPDGWCGVNMGKVRYVNKVTGERRLLYPWSSEAGSSLWERGWNNF